jgi:signal transduction histidine kinase
VRAALRRPDLALGGLVVAGVAAGAVAVEAALRSPDWALAASSRAALLLGVLAGAALIVSGVAAWKRHAASALGYLLTATALTWFVVDWNNPGIDSAPVFTAGLVLSGVFPVLVGHAALVHAATGRPSWVERAAVALAYAGAVGALGLLPALFFDPSAQGCGDCPRNLVVLTDAGGTATALTRAGLVLGVGWAALLVVLLLWRLARATGPARRVIGPVALPAIAVLALAATDFGHGLGRGFQSNDPTDRRLWLAEAAALLALAAGTTWERVRNRRTRAALARLVVDLAAAPPPGGLADVLAELLGDPTLQLVYANDEESWVDAAGRPANPGHGGAEVTQLMAGGRVVAALTHRRGLLSDPGLVREIASAARLALDHERLRAQLGAQLARLRASRARIVAAGDAERRRLERDLHDGAQQRLVAVALGLRLAALQTRDDPGLAAALAATEEDLREAVAELRDVAHGIHPMALSDGGLAGAVDALADRTDRVVPGALTDERFPPTVESAAYFVIAEALRCTEAHLVVDVARDDGHVVVELRVDGEPPDNLTDLEDRVGAVDGRVAVERAGAASRIRAEIPCA